MQLDKVITLAIGRNGSTGILSDDDWLAFQEKAKNIMAQYATVVAATSGPGVGSDDDREDVPEDSAVIVAINPGNAGKLRRDLAQLLKEYHQSSAALARDTSHRPIFATASGRRPATA